MIINDYIITISFGCVSLIILGLIIYSYIQTKRRQEDTFAEFTLLWFFIPLLFVVNGLLFSAEHHEAIYNYKWRYTCKIYYYDGGIEIRSFNCGGSQYPRIARASGGFIFVCGDNIVNAVTRFEVIKKEKINYESD